METVVPLQWLVTSAAFMLQHCCNWLAGALPRAPGPGGLAGLGIYWVINTVDGQSRSGAGMYNALKTSQTTKISR
jgi:hypothetical protein